jgi:FAD/FMN-containing dehydrogenase
VTRQAERERLWKARKAQGGLLGQISPDFRGAGRCHPETAPRGDAEVHLRTGGCIEGIAAVTIMHAGDGNLHPDFLLDARDPGQVEKVERIGKNLMRKVSAKSGVRCRASTGSDSTRPATWPNHFRSGRAGHAALRSRRPLIRGIS